MFNMREIVGEYDILMITIDTLRYDVAKSEEEKGNTPNICNKRRWEKRHTPGSFTFAAHQAFFAGFLPTPANGKKGERLFAARFTGSETTGKNTFVFETDNIVDGLKKEGYKTICIGGVGFFNSDFPLGKVLPGYFEESYWESRFGVTNKESTKNQVEFAIERLKLIDKNNKFMLFMNVAALHQPNYFYLEESEDKSDTIHSHAAALRYVDKELDKIFKYLKSTERKVFCIICSDHGTAYGEDGFYGHRVAHDVVWNVPYMEFII